MDSSGETKSEHELHAILRALRSTTSKLPDSEYFYSGPVDFVLQEGRFFPPRPLLPELELQPSEPCFAYAQSISAALGLRYVEGYAFDSEGLAMLHAWNLDAQRFVVDAMWKPVSAAYMGVVLPIKGSKGAGKSFIDDWENRWPLLRKQYKVVRSLSEQT